ncbi:hypothetical protein V2H45_15540 [Tumidithrix elongata RA019]|uniref:Uncharacterized protein n=1 Tax=Tumidithrix elongata BACA0141 TaxID=2716417 RepID=A0AAW9Q5J5_9CYAN|nr:hypothetical protein [Tumidithrix elongata RA019]
MRHKKFFLSCAVLSLLLLFPAIASSQQVDVKSGNTRTIVDDDGNVRIETDPSSIDFQSTPLPTDNPSNFSRGTRTYSTNDSNNCHNDSYTYKNNDGGNSVYSHSSTTVCR